MFNMELCLQLGRWFRLQRMAACPPFLPKRFVQQMFRRTTISQFIAVDGFGSKHNATHHCCKTATNEIYQTLNITA
jgi:hypothetical protein